MANVTVQSRINPELKAEAEEVFAEMGMTIGDAIRIFIQQSVNVGGLPFKPQTKQPNAATIAAMEELANGGGETFSSAAALFASWEQD